MVFTCAREREGGIVDDFYIQVPLNMPILDVYMRVS